jgi:glycosyltransferase involved in cell wall biosynthesis
MSGGIRVIAIHARALAERGHQVTLVSTPRPRRSGRDHIKAALGLWPSTRPKSHLDGTGLDLRVLEKARPIVDADLPDADVVVATWWETAEWAARLAANKGRKYYFVQAHEIYFKGFEARARATYRLPLKKITVSRWLARVIADEYGDTTCTIVENSVDHDQFNAPVRGKRPRPTVGFVYHHNPSKGMDVAMRALEILRTRLPDLRLITFGAYEPRFDRGKLGEFEFDPRQDRLKNLYGACDVWLIPSRTEGFGLVAMEAMACGTPVVSTRPGWAGEAIKGGINGALVEIDDATGLADKAAEILSLPDDRWRQMSAAAFETVRDSSWERSSGLFEAALAQDRRE